MANHVAVTICGQEYTLIAEESAAYTEKVAAYAAARMQEVLNGAHVGWTDAAVLAAVNITDELFKTQEANQQLRSQIKGYLDEAAKAQAQAGDLKRQVLRLQQRLDSRQK